MLLVSFTPSDAEEIRNLHNWQRSRQRNTCFQACTSNDECSGSSLCNVCKKSFLGKRCSSLGEPGNCNVVCDTNEDCQIDGDACTICNSVTKTCSGGCNSECYSDADCAGGDSCNKCNYYSNSCVYGKPVSTDEPSVSSVPSDLLSATNMPSLAPSQQTSDVPSISSQPSVSDVRSNQPTVSDSCLSSCRRNNECFGNKFCKVCRKAPYDFSKRCSSIGEPGNCNVACDTDEDCRVDEDACTICNSVTKTCTGGCFSECNSDADCAGGGDLCNKCSSFSNQCVYGEPEPSTIPSNTPSARPSL